MSLIEIKKVESKKDLKTFIDFHYDLYEGNEYDVPNLFSDEMNTLSKDKNAAFEFCEAEYYLAYKERYEYAKKRKLKSDLPKVPSSDRSASAQPDWIAPSKGVCPAAPWANNPASRNDRDSHAGRDNRHDSPTAS